MKKRKIAAIVVMIIAVLVSSYVYYSKIYLIQESVIPHEIQEKISKSEIIDLNHIIDGEWDTLYVISPYTSKKDAQKDFGVNLDRLQNDSIKYADGQALFLFCRGKQIESYFYIKYPFAEIDYESLPKKHILARDETIFEPVNEQPVCKLVKLNTTSPPAALS